MKKSRTKMKIQTMHDWLMTPVGQYILNWEETLFQTLSADIFGFGETLHIRRRGGRGAESEGDGRAGADRIQPQRPGID